MQPMMEFDLEGLGVMHKRLSAETAADLAQKAAHALQRRHEPGVLLMLENEGASIDPAKLLWQRRDEEHAEQLDRHRVTEDGAEAIALCLVHELEGWCVRRRLQRDDHADYLLEQPDTDRRLALEVSGTDAQSLAGRMTEKLESVGKARYTYRAACVVHFVKPRAALRRHRAHDDPRRTLH